MMVPDIKTVIRGLEICTRPWTDGCSDELTKCPYKGKGCRRRMEADALFLLKSLSGLNEEAATDDVERHDGFCEVRYDQSK